MQRYYKIDFTHTTISVKLNLDVEYSHITSIPFHNNQFYENNKVAITFLKLLSIKKCSMQIPGLYIYISSIPYNCI
jgi:hypothetical protein